MTRAFGPLTSTDSFRSFERLYDCVRPSLALYEDLCRIRAEARHSPLVAVAGDCGSNGVSGLTRRA